MGNINEYLLPPSLEAQVITGFQLLSLENFNPLDVD